MDVNIGYDRLRKRIVKRVKALYPPGTVIQLGSAGGKFDVRVFANQPLSPEERAIEDALDERRAKLNADSTMRDLESRIAREEAELKAAKKRLRDMKRRKP
jgi:hypothetical protein